MGPLILEVADQRGRVASRTWISAAGLAVGRGLRNDVIVDDPYVDPVHLRILPTEAGGWRFEDAGSLNGTWEARHHRRLTAGEVHPGVELRIGRSLLRVVAADGEVPPALYDPAGRHRIGWLLEPRHAGAVIGGAVAYSAGSAYLASAERATLTELFTPAVAGLLLAALWAAAWAFTNRIVAQRFRFLGHLAWTALVATALGVTATVFEWASFFLPAVDLAPVEGLAVGGLVVTLLAGHFELVTEWSARRRWGVATASAVVVALVIGLLGQAAGGLGTDTVDRVGVLKPVAARFLPGSSIDRFFDRAAALKTRADADADEGEANAEDSESRPDGAPPA